MAKKTVATLRDKTKISMAKVIIPVKNEKTGAYSYREEFIPQDQVSEFIKNSKS